MVYVNTTTHAPYDTPYSVPILIGWWLLRCYDHKRNASRPHEYGIIVCGMRFFNGEFSEYYRDFCTMHKHEPPARLYGLASMALVTTSIAVKNKFTVFLTWA